MLQLELKFLGLPLLPRESQWLISLLLPLFSTQKIEEQRRKVLATLTQVHNEEHRHRVKIQTHTQNKE